MSISLNDSKSVFTHLRMEKYLQNFLNEDMEPADILLLPPSEQIKIIPKKGPRIRLIDFLCCEHSSDPRVFNYLKRNRNGSPSLLIKSPSLQIKVPSPEHSPSLNNSDSLKSQLNGQYINGAVTKPSPIISSSPQNSEKQNHRESMEINGNGNHEIPSPHSSPPPSLPPSPPPSPNSSHTKKTSAQVYKKPILNDEEECRIMKTIFPLEEKPEMDAIPATFIGELIFYQPDKEYGFLRLLHSSTGETFKRQSHIYFSSKALPNTERLSLVNGQRLFFNLKIDDPSYPSLKNGICSKNSNLLSEYIRKTDGDENAHKKRKTPMVATRIWISEGSNAAKNAHEIERSKESKSDHLHRGDGAKVEPMDNKTSKKEEERRQRSKCEHEKFVHWVFQDHLP